MTDTVTSGACRVRVLLFSILREKVGREVCEFTLPAGVTASGLLDHLETVYPVLRPYRPVIRLAVNRAYVPGTVALSDGDEVALITPVSGG